MLKKLLFVLLLLNATVFFSQDTGKTKWQEVEGPNYTINQHLAYPYSNKDVTTSLSEKVTVIPAQLTSYIHLIDFYGEGRIVDKGSVLGFKSAYNINLEYRLVSRGPDEGRRIPNRIPVASYDGELGLSRFVANDRVNTITLMKKSYLKQNTVTEIARMIRKDRFGKIILYGFKSTDSEVEILEKKLAEIGYTYVANYILETPFNEIKGFINPPRVYQSKKIKAIGEQVFYSINPKTDPVNSLSDMVRLDYTSLLALNADLTGGIKGLIDKPNGNIEVEVFAYDNEESDGIQKFSIYESPDRRNKTVYKAFTDSSSIEDYEEKLTSIPYGFAKNLDGSFHALGETLSNNVKLLGASSSSGWADSACSWNVIRFTRWLTWNIKSLFYKHVPYECQDVVTEIRSGKHPVLIKLTLKDATLYDLKIPGISDYDINKFITDTSKKGSKDSKKKLQEYKIIKKLIITVLESPDESMNANYYTEKIGRQIKEANRYFSAKTGYVMNSEIAAEVGNPRILFNNVDLIIKKGSKQSYNLQQKPELAILEKEIGFKTTDDEIIQLMYVHTVKLSDISNPVEHILGFTYSVGNTIQNLHFCIFSYNDLFTISPNNIGTSGTTFAHELGHYFDLKHPFQGGCSETDGSDLVSDTPPAEGAEWHVINPSTTNSSLLQNPCENAPRTCNGRRRQIENLMDYGPCRWLFTKGQVERITNRINTKPSLFTTLMAYDSDIDPDAVTINVSDKRREDLRRKRSLSNHDFHIEMQDSDSNSDYRDLTISSERPGNVMVRIYDINSVLIYKNNVTVQEGLNHFQIASSLFKPNTLYIISCTNDYTTEQIKFIARHY